MLLQILILTSNSNAVKFCETNQHSTRISDSLFLILYLPMHFFRFLESSLFLSTIFLKLREFSSNFIDLCIFHACLDFILGFSCIFFRDSRRLIISNKLKLFEFCNVFFFYFKGYKIPNLIPTWTKSTFDFQLCFSIMAAPGERYHVLAQLEHLQSKYTGCGHADTSRYKIVVEKKDFW